MLCYLPCCCSLFCVIFFLNPSPTSRPLKKTVELQSIKFKVSHNLLFGLYKFLALSNFFSHLKISIFRIFFFHCCEWLVRECGYGELMAVSIRFWGNRWGGLGLRCRHWGATQSTKKQVRWVVLIVFCCSVWLVRIGYKESKLLSQKIESLPLQLLGLIKMSF